MKVNKIISNINININKDYNEINNPYPNISNLDEDSIRSNNANMFGKIFTQTKNEILYDEIFLDGNSDNYDMILNFDSFEQLKLDGWTANFSIEGLEKYKKSIQNNNIIIGVVGIKNRGKSYLLKRIMNNENYKPNAGFLVTTYGISCGFPILNYNNVYQAFITLDTAGRENPLLQNAFYQEHDIKSVIQDQKVCEILLSDFIIKESNVLILVVEQLSFAEQEMILTLTNRLRLKEVYNNIDKRRLIIIHNLMNISKNEDIQKFIDKTLLRSMTFNLEARYVKDHENEAYNVTVYDQIIENNDNNKLEIVHLVIGNDKIDEILKKYNEPAFKYIRDYIKIASLRKFDILESFKEFIINNYKKFINTNLLENNPLIIGDEKKVKVYTDKKKTKDKIKDKVIIPIKLTNQKNVEDIHFKNFYFDGEMYRNTEPLYSCKMVKIDDKDYLEITFEMYGKITKIQSDINYYDNNDNNDEKIIIEVKGKSEEFELDFLKNEDKYEKFGQPKGNLNYSEFDFQVVIDNRKEIKNKKYYIDIENDEPIRNSDENSGIHSLLFPINLYEI